MLAEEQRKNTAQKILVELNGKGFSPAQLSQIASNMGSSISQRTLYRWLRGETVPQRDSDIDVLKSMSLKLKDALK